MWRKYVVVFCQLLFVWALQGQTLTQSIRGVVFDNSTEETIPFASVVLENDSAHGSSANIEGHFILEEVPLGRYNIVVSAVGFQPTILQNVLVTAAKAVRLEVALEPAINTLGTAIITPTIQKEMALNKMATVSSRMLSVEEASRYAGGFDDPARLASSFAGVGSNVSSNAIIIRGNAPKFTQWKLEGIEIPNPNHFADVGGFGGGGLTALSSNLLDNSDFYTGAFPAVYTNALSGVFDMRMRFGNSNERETSVEIGVIGVDLSSEGPLSNQGNGSYLFNYRYSTLGLVAPLLPEEAQGTNYQDLAFKVKLPSKGKSVISLWGIGLLDHSGAQAKKDTLNWVYVSDQNQEMATQKMGAIGLNHRLIFSSKNYLNTSIGASNSGLDFATNRVDTEMISRPISSIKNNNYDFTFKSVFNQNFSKRHSNQIGVNAIYKLYDFDMQQVGGQQDLESVVSENGSSMLLSAFTNSRITYEQFSAVVGFAGQFFTLNNSGSVEPRLGIEYQINSRNKLSFGYGLHSRIERLSVYFAMDAARGSLLNKQLGFTKAHHLVIGYEKNFGEHLHFKIEPYFQYLFDVPVVTTSQLSLINLERDFFIQDKLVNEGLGRNYGVDLTLEKYISNGFYYLLTGSIFTAQYSNNGQQWHHTRFNRGHVFNGLLGKEFVLNKQKGNLLSLNVRMSWQGGQRYTTIDAERSRQEKEVVYQSNPTFTEQASAILVTHFTMNYQWNTKNTTQKLSLKVLNANNHKEFLGHRFNLTTEMVDVQEEGLLIPNLSYKISF